MAPCWKQAAVASVLLAAVGSGSDLVSPSSGSAINSMPSPPRTFLAEWLDRIELPRHIEVLDVSHSPHLRSGEITKRLDRRIAKVHSEGHSHNRHVLLDIDVSSCSLGDRGVLDVLRYVAGFCQDNASSDPQGASEPAVDRTSSEEISESLITRFCVAARMNGLTTKGASRLFDMLYSPSNATVTNATEPDDGEDNRTETSLQTENATKESASLTSAQIHQTAQRRHYILDELDIGLNDIGTHVHDGSMRSLLQSIRSLVEATGSAKSDSNSFGCPRVLRLDRCGVHPPVCRALGKGILNAAKDAGEATKDEALCDTSLECLHLSGNIDIGDAGTAALAAALRTSPATRRHGSTSPPYVLDILDLSSCGLGHAGAEALALAIADNPGCVRRLDLSNNQIPEEGITRIAAALQTAQRKMQANVDSLSKVGTSQNDLRSRRRKGGSNSFGSVSPPIFAMDKLNLSNNVGLGDAGLQAVAGAIKSGAVRSVVLRSCGIGADGATALGKAMTSLALQRRSSRHPCELELDLSGNSFGVRLPKKKEKPASILTSKATETTKSYVSFIGNRIKKGLRDVGLEVGSSSTGDGESDDEEEAKMGSIMADLVGDSASAPASGGRCGAQAFADAILEANNAKKGRSRRTTPYLRSRVGMRRCFLDEGASDALAAAMLHAREHLGLDMTFDVTLNGEALEEETVAALGAGVDAKNVELEDNAQRYLDNLDMRRSGGGSQRREGRRRESSLLGDESRISDVGMADFEQYQSEGTQETNVG